MTLFAKAVERYQRKLQKILSLAGQPEVNDSWRWAHSIPNPTLKDCQWVPGEEGTARMRTIYRSLCPDCAAGQGGAECFLLRTSALTVYRLLHLFTLRLL